MKNLTLKEITRICKGNYIGGNELLEVEVTAITSDSRQVESGGLFIPIIGTRVDGHDFIPQVMEAGALCTLSEVNLGEVDFPYIQVTSTLDAIKEIAEFYLQQLDIPIVGITGSVGKTSTKEMIASVLSQRFRVLKTLGNFNNELGLPFTIFRLREGDEAAVLEMGISDFGEMSRLTKIAKPDIAVITNIGICHLENLGDRDGVLKAKTEIFQSMKSTGHIILNGDDDKLSTVSETKGIQPIFFGLGERNSYFATDVENLGLRGINCTIHTPTKTFTVHIQIPGEHMIFNALAATAVGEQLGLTQQELQQGIQACVPVGGRNNIIEKNGITVIDDCYNANPISMKSGLEVLSETQGRKVAILGDMGELGKDEILHHEEIGSFAVQQGISVLVAVGPLSLHMAEAARARDNSSMEIYHYPTREALLEDINKIIKKGDTILVKASHFMKFEEIVKQLCQ